MRARKYFARRDGAGGQCGSHDVSVRVLTRLDSVAWWETQQTYSRLPQTAHDVISFSICKCPFNSELNSGQPKKKSLVFAICVVVTSYFRYFLSIFAFYSAAFLRHLSCAICGESVLYPGFRRYGSGLACQRATLHGRSPRSLTHDGAVPGTGSIHRSCASPGRACHPISQITFRTSPWLSTPD